MVVWCQYETKRVTINYSCFKILGTEVSIVLFSNMYTLEYCIRRRGGHVLARQLLGTVCIIHDLKFLQDICNYRYHNFYSCYNLYRVEASALLLR